MNNKKLFTAIMSSQEKVFWDTEPVTSITEASILSGEAYYFNYAYRAANGANLPISVTVKADGLPVNVYRVDCVSIPHTVSGFDEVGSLKRGGGAYPDLMMPRGSEQLILGEGTHSFPYFEKDESCTLAATLDATKSLIIGINEDGEPTETGTYNVTVTVRSLEDGEIIAEDSLSLRIIAAKLPKLDFLYTNWVHYDCIADIHDVPVWSDKYFEILASYLKCARRYGMTLLLTPTFTPALDTPVGQTRMKTQLVGIEKNGDAYSFDFTLLERFIVTALEAGFTNLEHTHLFTQWGAEHAPSIYVTENGEEKLLFGWHTDVCDGAYRNFLSQYVPAVKAIASRYGVKLFWHVSDEPTAGNVATYAKAVGVIGDLLDGESSGDALSDIRFYEDGLVKTPIVSIDCVHRFFGKCESLWGYYTGGYYGNHTTEKCTNRLITDEPYRTRISGLHFYRYKLSGFLHWGYNFYYDKMAKGIVDPKLTPSGYKNMPGAAFIVYPWIGSCLPSLRSVYMKEALSDLAALRALEELTDYESVMSLCESFFGASVDAECIPVSSEQMLAFREMINREIEKRI